MRNRKWEVGSEEKKRTAIRAIKKRGVPRNLVFIFLLFLISHSVFPVSVSADVLERIVAIVNDDVILLSEFKEELRRVEEYGSDFSEEGVLNDMINKMLLLNEAKKFRLNTRSSRSEITVEDHDIVNEYVERRIKAFIHVPYEDIEAYYRENSERFEGREFYDVRDDIEQYLIREELKFRVQDHIDELRKKSYIRIQLETGGD